MPIYDCETGETRDETPEELAAIEAERAASLLVIPDVVSARQMKLTLLGADLLDDIETFVSSQERGVQISWEYATEFHRGDPLLAGMAKAFGLTDEQVDEIFRTAAGL